MFWSMHTGILAAIATVFARYAAYFVPMGDNMLRATAVSAIVALSVVNYLGVKLGSRVQTAFTVVKVLAVAGIIVASVVLKPDTVAASATAVDFTAADFLLAVAVVRGRVVQGPRTGVMLTTKRR